jgi:hypothetical protein
LWCLNCCGLAVAAGEEQEHRAFTAMRILRKLTRVSQIRAEMPPRIEARFMPWTGNNEHSIRPTWNTGCYSIGTLMHIKLRAIAPTAIAYAPRLKEAGTVFTYYCDAVAVLSSASCTLDTQHFEFALDLAEYEIGSGHGRDPMGGMPVHAKCQFTLSGGGRFLFSPADRKALFCDAHHRRWTRQLSNVASELEGFCHETAFCSCSRGRRDRLRRIGAGQLCTQGERCPGKDSVGRP